MDKAGSQSTGPSHKADAGPVGSGQHAAEKAPAGPVGSGQHAAEKAPAGPVGSGQHAADKYPAGPAGGGQHAADKVDKQEGKPVVAGSPGESKPFGAMAGKALEVNALELEGEPGVAGQRFEVYATAGETCLAAVIPHYDTATAVVCMGQAGWYRVDYLAGGQVRERRHLETERIVLAFEPEPGAGGLDGGKSNDGSKEP
jgi:hypothetical protein